METVSRPAISLSDAVAKEIRIALIRMDLKQSDLSIRMKRSEMWVSRRLRGAQPIDLNDLQEFAEALGKSPTDLIPRGLTPTASPQADHTPGTNARSPQPPSRPTLTGQRKRADGRESNRRPGRITPLGAETITDRRTAEFFDTQAA